MFSPVLLDEIRSQIYSMDLRNLHERDLGRQFSNWTRGRGGTTERGTVFGGSIKGKQQFYGDPRSVKVKIPGGQQGYFIGHTHPPGPHGYTQLSALPSEQDILSFVNAVQQGAAGMGISAGEYELKMYPGRIFQRRGKVSRANLSRYSKAVEAGDFQSALSSLKIMGFDIDINVEC